MNIFYAIIITFREKEWTKLLEMLLSKKRESQSGAQPIEFV